LRADKSAVVGRERVSGDTEAVRTVAAPRAETEDGRVRISYRVKAGDTLAAIARSFKTTIDALQSWNSGLRGTRISAGHTLTIYTRR